MIVFWNVRFCYPFTIKPNKSIVRRVHWLRARAQYMRWREEATLTSYEMQWTVRHFVHKSTTWADSFNRLAEGGRCNAGVLAYCKRKYSTWRHIAIKADRTFSIFNTAYKSPL